MIGLPSSGCRRASNQLPLRFTYSSEEEDNRKPKANGNPIRRKTVVHAPTQSLGVEIDETPKQCGYLSNRYNHPMMEEKEERREKITINVSGERYQTFVDTLDRFPTTLLGNLLKREQFYDDVEDEYFFDRDRSAFNAILYYYQSNGQLYCPLTVPMTILVTEAKFFQLGNDALKQVLDLQDEKQKEEMPKNKFQKKVWCLFEHPETSRAAHILTLFSMLMILLSVLILCVETLQVFKSTHSIPSKKNEIILKNKTVNDENDFINLLSLAIQLTNNNMTLNEETITERKSITLDIFLESCSCRCQCVSNNTILKELYETMKYTKEDGSFNWRDLFDTCEAIFVAWFTVEFIVRMCACPSKCAFMKNYLNIIDIVSILPFYITTVFNKHTGFGLENFRIIRLIRVFRIFKLSRHSKGLQILGLTLQASIGELGLMLFFLAIGVVLFSSAAYYLEDGNFASIPDAFWWALITMCTVGYGDKVPKSFFGKVVGGACAICGVLSIALPVPVIVSNFDYFYNRERTKKLHESYISDEEEEGREEVESPVHHKTINVEINDTDKKSPLLNRQKNGSIKSIRSPIETRNDEIQRQATIRGLERRNRKLSQRLSQSSMNSPRKCITGMATTPEEY